MHAQSKHLMLNIIPAAVRIATITALLLGCSSTVWAAPYDWNAAGGGTYSVPANWTPAGPPIAGDNAHFGLAGTYTVNFTAAAASDTLLVNSTNAVSFDLAGNTYTVGVASAAVPITTGGTSSLVLSSTGSGGTLSSFGPVGGSNLVVGAGTSLKINNSLGSSATLNHRYGASITGTLEVDGPGAVYNNIVAGGSWDIQTGSTINVLNGAQFTANNVTTIPAGNHTINVSGTGSKISMFGSVARMIANSGNVNVISGGEFFAGSQLELGVFFSTGGTFTVGNGVGTSLASGTDIRFGTTSTSDRSYPEMIINTGGIARARSLTTDSFYVYDRAKATLNGGTIEIVADGELDVAENVAGGDRSLFRGAGTVNRFGAGVNFTITNSGNIDVGDTTGLPGAGNTIGTITVNNGDLIQDTTGITFLDFNPSIAGSNDLIRINSGTATINGTVDFDAIAGTLTLGDWDFLRATSIIYNATDNMAALLGSLTVDASWNITFGVVDFGAYDVLRLHVQPAPEPSTFALLGLGVIGLAIKNRRRRGLVRK